MQAIEKNGGIDKFLGSVLHVKATFGRIFYFSWIVTSPALVPDSSIRSLFPDICVCLFPTERRVAYDMVELCSLALLTQEL